MADWTVSTNFISWPPAHQGIFGWPTDTSEAGVIRRMEPGDLIVPKFAQAPGLPNQESYQRAICDVLDRDFEADLAAYTRTIDGGNGAVPFVMRVERQLGDIQTFPSFPPYPWACVEVDLLPLTYPLSTSEYLRLRTIPIEIAGQFKAMAAPNRHVQKLPRRTGRSVLDAGEQPKRGPELLRQHFLVHAGSSAEAVDHLRRRGTELFPGDRAFLIADASIAGLHVVDEVGELRPRGEPVGFGPRQLLGLLEEARHRATPADGFRPARTISGVRQVADMLVRGEEVVEVPQFGRFHDSFVLLPRKVTEALDLVRRRPAPATLHPPEPLPEDEDVDSENEETAEDAEQSAFDRLQGLAVTAVRAALPPAMSVPDSVLAEVVTALRSGKHLLLSGPPGTGKSTLAVSLCRAVVENQYRLTTATAGWTAFDTIGGYMPEPGGELAFEPGVVLQCLKDGSWLVIDELNRADIDKAFGPLFTLLSGGGMAAQDSVVLPYRDAQRPVEIVWSERLSSDAQRYAVTPSWRLIGTMNVADKASLFQLSFAFLRRFAVIDVPLPDEKAYRQLFATALGGAPIDTPGPIVDAAMRLAFGPVELGPAILLDIAAFTTRGLIETSSGDAPYADPIVAFLTAVRLYAVPQYEGATPEHAERLLATLDEVFPDPPAVPMRQLTSALDAMTLV